MLVSAPIYVEEFSYTIQSTQRPSLFMTLNPIIDANGSTLFPAMIQAVGDLATAEGSSWFINTGVKTTVNNGTVTTIPSVSIQNGITCGWLTPDPNGINVNAIHGNAFYWDLVSLVGGYAFGLPNSSLFVAVAGSGDKTPLMLTPPASTNSNGGDTDPTHIWSFQKSNETAVACPKMLVPR